MQKHCEIIRYHPVARQRHGVRQSSAALEGVHSLVAGRSFRSHGFGAENPKRQRPGVLQNLAEFVAALDSRQRLGVRAPCQAVVSEGWRCAALATPACQWAIHHPNYNPLPNAVPAFAPLAPLFGHSKLRPPPVTFADTYGHLNDRP